MVAVIVVSPMLTPVTTPDELTVATLVSELVQVTVLVVVFSGKIVATKVSVLVSSTVMVVLSNVILSANIRLLTVTIQVSVRPYLVVAVMTAVPTPTGVTRPPSTVATLSSELDQVSVLYVVLYGVNDVPTLLGLSPSTKVIVAVILILVARTSFVAIILYEDLTLSRVDAVILIVPSPITVTTPLESTVVTLSSELDHDNSGYDALVGYTLHANCTSVES